MHWFVGRTAICIGQIPDPKDRRQRRACSDGQLVNTSVTRISFWPVVGGELAVAHGDLIRDLIKQRPWDTEIGRSKHAGKCFHQQ